MTDLYRIISSAIARRGGRLGILVLVMLLPAALNAEQTPKPGAATELLSNRQYAGVERLGIEFQALSAQLAQAFEWQPAQQQGSGVLILWVQPNSPAADAELAAGDIIISFNGTAVNDLNQLLQLLKEIPPTQTIDLQIWRLGEREERQLTLPAASGSTEFEAVSRADTAASYENNSLRLGVADLDHDLRQAFGNRGVLVEGVAPGPASIAGIQAGDSLLMIERLNVANAAQFNGLVKSLPKNKPMPVLIERDGRMRFVVITLHE